MVIIEFNVQSNKALAEHATTVAVDIFTSVILCTHIIDLTDIVCSWLTDGEHR